MSTLLEPAEIQVLLLRLSSVYIVIVLPARWLVGNTQDLVEYTFGIVVMAQFIDLMATIFLEVAKDGENLLDGELTI